MDRLRALTPNSSPTNKHAALVRGLPRRLQAVLDAANQAESRLVTFPTETTDRRRHGSPDRLLPVPPRTIRLTAAWATWHGGKGASAEQVLMEDDNGRDGMVAHPPSSSVIRRGQRAPNSRLRINANSRQKQPHASFSISSMIWSFTCI